VTVTTTLPSTDTPVVPGDRGPGDLADVQTHFEVEQFYYREAELLDDGRYADWLELLADDLDYWMPTRSNRLRRQQALSVAQRGEAAFYDESKESLAWRIRRFDSGMAWAEDPPSRTRHLVGNLEVAPLARGEVQAKTAFLVYRSHLETDHQLLSGCREDVLRRVKGEWKIARRTIVLDANVLLDKNLSVFL